ncbi:PHP domain-containing protein [Halioglobus maricola]|uniref:PHP domain-containing protein n=1 Tax=Halioglobus maricola TaxID=2601894 RepID=A0A5P9NRT7_9GAMM|nr:PHP domain-containing protein [Halioglobus maricola]
MDFHTHTTASDGALTPRELLQRASEAGIDLFAITDHDTMAGYLEASQFQLDYPTVKLVPGVEVSCRWSATTIHVVGLGVDCQHPAMCEGLAELDTARTARGIKIAERLASRGFPGALEGAQIEAGGGQLGRPHFASWMVAQGHVPDHNTAFDKYLGQGKPGDVKAFWPELARAVAWIVDAGGIAVLAHPLKYKYTRMKLRRLVQDFAEAGGTAVEALSGRQTPDQTAQLLRLAEDFELDVSAGSDFHRDGPYSPRLGVELLRLEARSGVWRHFESAQENPEEAR